MTEKSYFFDGVTIGDAQEAPYDSDLLSDVWYKLFGSGVDSFVHPSATNSFLVTTNGVSMNISVAAGSARVQGRFYTCTATPFLVPDNTSSLPRIDRVVIRIDKKNSTGRLALKMGVPGYAPQPAVVERTDAIYEMSVARIYVPAGIAALNAYNVIDEREFWGPVFTSGNFEAENDNIMPNSEFIAGAGTNFDTAPAMWTVINTATCTRVTKFAQQARGSGVKVACPATGDGIQTTVDRLADTNGNYYTVRLLIEVISGEVNVNTGGASVGSRIPPTGGPVEVLVRQTMINTYQSMNISITNTSAGASEFILGQVTLTPGFVGAPFIPKKELILFGAPVTQVAYPTLYTENQSYELDLISDLVGVSTLITRLDLSGGNSGGSNDVSASLQDVTNNSDQLRIEIGRLTTGGVASAQGFIGAPRNLVGEQKLQLTTVGTTTLQVGIYHLGCVT